MSTMSVLCGKQTPGGWPCQRPVVAHGAPCGVTHPDQAGVAPTGKPTPGPLAAPADPLGADGSTAASPEEVRRRAPELVYSGASVRSVALELGVSDDDVRSALDAVGREEAAARRAQSRVPDGATAASPEETRRRAPGLVAAGASVRSVALQLGVSDDDVRSALDHDEAASRRFPPLRNGVAGQLAACRALYTDDTVARVEAVFAQVDPNWLAAHGTVEHTGPDGQLIRVRDFDGVTVLAHVDTAGGASIIGFSHT